MHKKFAFLILIPLLMCTGCEITTTVIKDSEIQDDVNDELLEFTNCVLVDKTFTYDGNFHQLVVVGAPEGTSIVYSNNSQKEVGSYVVTATLSKEGYKDKTLTAHLTINEALKDFTGISFKSKTITYNGEEHSLVLTGAPEGATITYSKNNGQTDVGVYTITATVSLEGYNTKTYTATLTILARKITGVIFKDETFKYDGMSHSIYATNLPKGTTASYSGNGQKSVGTYTVKATISGKGYETLVLTAKLIISDLKDFPVPNFSDLYFIYDNRDINLKYFFEDYEYEITKNCTKNYNVTYKINGTTKTNPTIKDVGTYNISATYSATNYETKTVSFKITISDQIGGVDSTKTPFQFTSNTKFKDLYNEIKKGNYSVKSTYRDEYDYDHDKIYEKVVESPIISNYFVTPNAFAGRRNENSTKYSTEDDFIIKGTDYAFRYHYDYFSLSKLKLPVSDYLETVTSISKGMMPFALLQESETGGFEGSFIGGYHNSYGSFEIDSENNQLIITSRVHYYHSEFDHDEVSEYIFYNVGNTKVTIPEAMKGKDSEASLFETNSFVENGISYSLGANGFIADVTLDEGDNAFLGGGGTYVLRPEIDGVPIKEIDYDVYYSSFNVDRSQYQINVYYNDEGYYQGQYADAGFVKYFRDANKFGNLYYYGEW